jgi:carboxymethylenebutenolidase
MSAITRFLAERLRSGHTEHFGTFFQSVERCLLDGNDEAAELIVVGLLEDLQNGNITKFDDYSVWMPFFARSRAERGRRSRSSGMAMPTLSVGSGSSRKVTRSMGTFETIEAGGTPSRLYVAGDFSPGTPGVVVFHAWWGLNDDVVAYADRLAAAGFAVVAPDLFGGQIAATVEEAERLSGGADEAAVDAIALAAVDDLAARLGPAAKLAALGFSFGAALAIAVPTERDRLAATVVYYGTYTGSILTRARVPVLGHFAESDPYETDEGVAAFEEELRAAGRDVVIHRYPGTGHWFAEPSRDAYRTEAADLAFERTVAFLGR